MLNSSGTSIDPSGTPLVTGFQLDFVPHEEPGHSAGFQSTQYMHQQLLYEDLKGDSVKSLTEV